MPVIVPSGAVNPPAPVQAVSPDGILTATLDGPHGGVLLEADFGAAGQPATTYAFAADAEGWAVYSSPTAGATATFDTGRLKITTVSDTCGAQVTLPHTYRDGIRVTLTAQGPVTASILRVAAGPAGATAAVWHDFPAPDATARTYTCDLAAGADVGQVTVYTDSTVAGESWWIDDVTVEQLSPHNIRFQRGDGQWVRSGDPARSPGASAIAYDHEAPLGQQTSWTAVPIFADGTEGAPSGPVTLTTPDVPRVRRNVWVKAINDPGLSMPLLAVMPLPTFARAGRLSLSDIPDSQYPAGPYDVPSARKTEMTVLTETAADHEAVEALFTSGPVLVQQRGDFGQRDRYYLPGDLTEAPVARMDSGARQWTVALSEIARPATIDAPLYIPGHSFDDLATVGTYNDVAAAYDSYDAIVGVT